MYSRVLIPVNTTGPDCIMDMGSHRQISIMIEQIGSLPVISGYYLVIGGGKIGSKFLGYAKRCHLPFVLVIDLDPRAPASRDAEILRDREHLADVLGSLDAGAKDNGHNARSMPLTGKGSNICFYCMDAKGIPSILEHGIPEYIVPAIPSHAAVDIVQDLVNQGAGRQLVHQPSISEEDSELAASFNDIVSYFPENIVAGTFPEHGAIFFSYAGQGEVCPDNCGGPEGYCYTFKRVKPGTVTSYVRELAGERTGWVFESCQMGPGIGGIRGADLKEDLLSILEYVRSAHEGPSPSGIRTRLFFIATTCNCHGILNILSLV